MYSGSLLSYLLLLLPIGGAVLWWNGVRAKELAVAHARKACRTEQLQFLDQTVALKRLRLSRSESGASCFQRVFEFEFTLEGAHRDRGTVELKGFSLVRVFLPYLRDSDGNRIYLQ
ncbi:MAG: DUF3301 domain-containing protein [Gammaproteobacteria bacterium]|nr:DUF3301 domain-containing protein [Gammaproteobacteria bacterium]